MFGFWNIFVFPGPDQTRYTINSRRKILKRGKELWRGLRLGLGADVHRVNSAIRDLD